MAVRPDYRGQQPAQPARVLVLMVVVLVMLVMLMAVIVVVIVVPVVAVVTCHSLRSFLRPIALSLAAQPMISGQADAIR